ncbi:hypothetical protein BGW41_006176 [Actinomortierella wolfii]|nr:hypothetical protein BGW41_006176 [Actinomortierella wolfii]
MGTFQGEPWSKSSTSAPSPQSTAADMTVASITGGDSRLMATAPLFRIQIDLAMLTIGPTQGVMIKFFIPKRPIAHQDKLTIQEIDIIENMLSVGHQQPLPQQKSQQEQNQSTQETTTPESSSNPLQSMSATESSHSGGIESLLLLGCLGGNSSSGGIDMAKVREMLGDMRIDQLPQGARDLMQTMEQQSQLRQPFSSNNNNSYTSPPTTEVTSSNTSTIPPDSTPGQPGLSTSGAPTSHPRSPQSPSEGLSPRAPTLLPHEDLFCTRSIIQHHQHRGSFSSIFSDSSVTSPLATGDPTQPVTREDLRLLESRIMHAIDRKLSQLEERIMAKLYARNRL